MANEKGPKSINFIRRLNRGNVGYFFEATSLKFGDLLAGWKLATNAKFQDTISKFMPARTKEHQDLGCEYHYSLQSSN